MASLYDLLCYHSLTSTDPLLEGLLSYLLPVFTLRTSFTLPMNTPWMKTQPFLSTLPLLHSTPLIQNFFLKNFYIFFIFYATPKVLPQKRALDIQMGRRSRRTDDSEESPKALHYYKATGVGEQIQLFPTFGQIRRREQPNPLPAVEWR